MNWRDDWRLMVALRYTGARAGNRLTSLTSLISGFGLILGVAILTIVLSVMNGFERELLERVLGLLPHGILYRAEGEIDVSAVRQHPRVLGAAPILESNGLLTANGKMKGIGLTGIDPVQESSVSILPHYFKEGSLSALDEERFGMVLGVRLASDLAVGLNDRVSFVLPEARITLAGALPTVRSFKVVGLFASGADADSSQAYISVTDMSLLYRGQLNQGVRVLTDDLFDAPQIIRDLILTGDGSFYGSAWQRRHGNLYGAIVMQKHTMFLMLLLLVAVAAFNLVSNLMMVVNDRSGDIAILRTVGASETSIRMLFVGHGILVGIAGIATGLCLGVVLSLIASDLVALVDRSLKLGLMDEYFIHYLPVDIRMTDLILIAGTSFMICCVATIYPAGKAARADPVEALQYEQ